MSPRIQANFSNISTEFQELPEGVYRARIEDIVDGKSSGDRPQLQFKLKVVEGSEEGKPISDFLTLTQGTDNAPNTISLGRIKAYAIAAVGEERANGEEIDTDELKLATVEIVVKHEAKRNREGKETGGTRAVIAKVLPVS